jgi:hypothetical protein
MTGARSARTLDEAALARRFRRHGESLARLARSPLYAELMRAAANDIDAGGPIAPLYAGVSIPPGSAPALRLLAPVHELVLNGSAPTLAEFYPSAGGSRPPAGVWPFAREAIEEHREWLAERLHRTVQTNDPGRGAVLYAALLWLTSRYGRPLRLLEIGASAGLNLLFDRWCYVVDGTELGDPNSPVRFVDPWQPAPGIDLAAAARELRVVERAGCDLAPLNPADPDDRARLLSYIWPDEVERIERASQALAIATREPAGVAAADAAEWLPARLTDGPREELTVIWHSVVRQYVADETWAMLNDGFRAAVSDVVWLGMEPAPAEQQHVVELTIRTAADEPPARLAVCGDHGPPVSWVA